MSAARALGGVCGGLLLAASGLRDRGGVLLLGATGVFGLGILGFALSDIFLVSLGFLLIIGAAGSALDTLGQSLIQRNVEDRERGAAMGVWFFAIGFGPFGHLGMGAAGAAIGAVKGVKDKDKKEAAEGAALGAITAYLMESGRGHELNLPKGAKLELELERALYLVKD